VVNHVRHPQAIPQSFPGEKTFYIKNGKPSSRFSSATSPGPTLTSMVRIRPDLVSMWSRLAVSNTVPLAGRAVACGLKPLDPDNVWTQESMYAPHRDRACDPLAWTGRHRGPYSLSHTGRRPPGRGR